MTDVLERIERRTVARDAMTRCLVAQRVWPHPGALGRVLGADPLSPESRRWFERAIDDRRFAAGLERDGVAALHSLPIGVADDLDHLILDAGGVVAVTIVDAPDGRIDVVDSDLRIDGAPTRILDRALEIREDVASRLGVALGRVVPVESVVVVLARSRPVAGDRTDVPLLTSAQLERWLARREARLTEAEVHEIREVSASASTWRSRTGDPVDDADFAELEREVRVARRRRHVWELTAMTVVLGGLLAVATGLPALLVRILAG